MKEMCFKFNRCIGSIGGNGSIGNSVSDPVLTQQGPLSYPCSSSSERTSCFLLVLGWYYYSTRRTFNSITGEKVLLLVLILLGPLVGEVPWTARPNLFVGCGCILCKERRLLMLSVGIFLFWVLATRTEWSMLVKATI